MDKGINFALRYLALSVALPIASLAGMLALPITPVHAQAVAASGTSSIDNKGNFIVDGNKFFPIGFYGINRTQPLSDRLAGLNVIAQSGFNTMFSEDISTPDFGVLLDEAARLNVKILVGSSSLLDDQYIGATVDKYKLKTAVLGWSLFDDADDGKVTPAQLKARSDFVKGKDPNHFTFATLTGYYTARRNAKSAWLQAADASSLQMYPITTLSDYSFDYGGNPLTESYRLSLDYALAAEQSGKAFVVNAQTFSWNTPASRYPTVKELRNMFYGHLMAGAKGIISYDYSTDLYSNQKPLWDEYVGLKNDILYTLKEPILDGTLTRKSTADAELSYSYWEHRGALYFAVLNTSVTATKQVNIPIPPSYRGTSTPLFPRLPSTLQFSNGVLSGIVGIADVQVYKIASAPNLTPVQAGNGTGLTYEFYNNKSLAGSPAYTGVDPNVDFDWGADAPSPGLPADDFSVRWSGQVQAPVGGSYVFSVIADNGVRLWINNALLIDRWTDSPAVSTSAASVVLTAGQKYNVKMEYYENTGSAVAKLLWSYANQPAQAIPQKFLYPVMAGGGPSPSPTPTPSVTQTIAYGASNENFANPERGFAYENDVPWPDKVTWDFCGQGNNFTAYNYTAWNTPLDASFLAQERAQGRSIVTSRYHIADFRNRDLTPEYLAFLERDFATARDAGIKIHVRFAYNYPFGGPDAPLAIILRHIDQLKPVLHNNKDVIAYQDAAFVGCWGEWHDSSNGLTYPNDGSGSPTDGRITPAQFQIIDKLLEALPSDRMLAIRYPRHKFNYFGNVDLTPIANLTESEAFSGSRRARIGFEDDCFVCNATHGGAYWNPRGDFTEAPNFIKEETKYVVQGGEPGDPESTDPSEPPNPNSPLSACATVESVFREQHWSLVGLYNLQSPASAIKRWERDGCLETFKQKLGYRFRLIETIAPTTARAGATLALSLKMANDGYARPYNPRLVEIVLRHQTTGVETRLNVATVQDKRLWLPAPGATTALPISVPLPANLPSGQYVIFLNLPDPEPRIYARPEFSIRLANTNTWEASTGYNSLLATVAVQP